MPVAGPEHETPDVPEDLFDDNGNGKANSPRRKRHRENKHRA